jgi:hypothetical protein
MINLPAQTVIERPSTKIHSASERTLFVRLAGYRGGMTVKRTKYPFWTKKDRK